MKCPICKKVDTLKIQYMYQYALENKILKNGAISKARPIRKNIGSEEWSAVTCTNCGAFWSSADCDNGYNLQGGHIHFDNEEQDKIAYSKQKE